MRCIHMLPYYNDASLILNPDTKQPFHHIDKGKTGLIIYSVLNYFQIGKFYEQPMYGQPMRM